MVQSMHKFQFRVVKATIIECEHAFFTICYLCAKASTLHTVYIYVGV